jgi:ribonuclease HII
MGDAIEVGGHAVAGFAAASAAAAASRFAWHVRQRVMPRMSQMMQMNVPQSTHGYPSEARSSFPQERQIIASCS